ncbi:hypothetical protein HPP92_028170 [Vanilla planifolia]|uniref:Uncharacterized protein n=1 Tax=Vanilla planifolia TaxID=51239 RepID=A0A835U4N8_VANPL|nr:hypothetical protein HPP92_028170 [Vanilla planifolia]
MRVERADRTWNGRSFVYVNLLDIDKVLELKNVQDSQQKPLVWPLLIAVGLPPSVRLISEKGKGCMQICKDKAGPRWLQA